MSGWKNGIMQVKFSEQHQLKTKLDCFSLSTTLQVPDVAHLVGLPFFLLRYKAPKLSVIEKFTNVYLHISPQSIDLLFSTHTTNITVIYFDIFTSGIYFIGKMQNQNGI